MDSDLKKRCKKCGSGETYLRISSKDLVCRKCGLIKKEDKK